MNVRQNTGMNGTSPAEQGAAAVGTVIGIVISVALVIGLVMGLDSDQFVQALKRLNPLYLPLFALFFFCSYWIRAERWRLLLPSHLELSSQKLFRALLVGAFASAVLPLRAGEFIRPWALSRWQPVSFATGLASVVTERVFDILAMLTYLFLVLEQIPEPPELVTVGAKALGLAAAAIATVMILAYFRARTMLAVSDRVFHWLFARRRPALYRTLQGMAEEFVGGLRAISSAKELALIIFWSLALWLEFAVLYQMILWSMGEAPSFWVGLAVNSVVALAVALPSSPGFIGTFQLGCVASLTTIYHYPREFSLAYSVIALGVQMAMTIAAGIWVLRTEGLRLGELRARAAGSVDTEPVRSQAAG